MMRAIRTLAHKAILVALLSTAGCAWNSSPRSTTLPEASLAVAEKPWRDETISQRFTDSIVVGGDNPGYESPFIRFRVGDIKESDSVVLVEINAESAHAGKIAYLKTRLMGRSGWDPMLAVADKDLRNLPPVSLHLKDDLGNAYRLLAIEPSEPYFHEIYPEQSKRVIALFKGPIVPQARTLYFHMRYIGSGTKTHEWSRPR